MFKRGSTFLFSLVGTLATLFAMLFSLILAALLCPSEVLYQSLVALPIFLLVGSGLIFLVAKYIGTPPDRPIDQHAMTYQLASVSLINSLVVIFAMFLVYWGIATLMEALILCSFCFFGCIATYKHFILD